MRAIDVMFAMCKASGFSVVVDGHLRFDLISGTIHLTADVFNSCSSKSLTIVAHECGHALQPYRLLLFLTVSAHVALYFLSIIAFMIGGLDTALRLFIIQFLVFRLLVLSIEFDASRRAYMWLRESNQVNMRIARKVLAEGFVSYLKLF